MAGQPNDWVDAYNGDVDNIGISPYSLSATQPGGTPSQGNQANPLGGLASALSMYGGGGSGIAMPTTPGYGNQSLNVAPNSSFIDPASTDLSI